MDLLETSARWLNEQREKFFSRKVKYRRGNEEIEIDSGSGKTTFLIDNGFGVRERFETRDFLITASALVLGGGPALPKRGDTIRDIQGNTIFVYEVMAPGKEPDWRYSDAYRIAFRIHTKQVATESA